MDCLCVFFSPYAPRDPVSPCVIIHLIHLSHLFHCSPPDLPRHPGSSALRLRSGSSTTCSAAVGWPPGVVSLSASKAPPSVGSTVGCNHGCCLGPAWLLLLQVPPVVSLTPPVSSLAPPCTLFIVLLPGIRPPPKFPPKIPSSPHYVDSMAQGRALWEEGNMLGLWTVCVCFSPHVLPATQFPHVWLVIWFACVRRLSLVTPWIWVSVCAFCLCPGLKVYVVLHVCSCLPCVTPWMLSKGLLFEFTARFLAPHPLHRPSWQ